MSNDQRMPIDPKEIQELTGPQGDTIARTIGVAVLSMLAIHYGSNALKNAGANLLKEHFSSVAFTARRTTSIAEDLFGVGKKLDSYSVRSMGQIKDDTPLGKEFALRAKARTAKHIKRMPYELLPLYAVERATQKPTGEDDTMSGRLKDMGKMVLNYYAADVMLGAALAPLAKTQAADFARKTMANVSPGALKWTQDQLDKGIIKGSSSSSALAAMYKYWQTQPYEKRVPTASNIKNLWKTKGRETFNTTKANLSARASLAFEPGSISLRRQSYGMALDESAYMERMTYSQDWVASLMSGSGISETQAGSVFRAISIGQDSRAAFRPSSLEAPIVAGSRPWYTRFGHTDKTIVPNLTELKLVTNKIPQLSNLSDNQLTSILQSTTERADNILRGAWVRMGESPTTRVGAIRPGGPLYQNQIYREYAELRQRYGKVDRNKLNALGMRKVTIGEYQDYIQARDALTPGFLTTQAKAYDDQIAASVRGGKNSAFYREYNKLAVGNNVYTTAVGTEKVTAKNMVDFTLEHSKFIGMLDKLEGYTKIPILNFNPMQLFQWRQRIENPQARWLEAGGYQPQLGGVTMTPHYQIGSKIFKWEGERVSNRVGGRLTRIPGEFIAYNTKYDTTTGRLVRNIFGLGDDVRPEIEGQQQRWLYRRAPRVAKALHITPYTSGSIGGFLHDWTKGAPSWWLYNRLKNKQTPLARRIGNYVEDTYLPKRAARIKAMGGAAHPEDVKDFLGVTANLLHPGMPAHVMDDVGKWLTPQYAFPSTQFLTREAGKVITDTRFTTETLINHTRNETKSIWEILELLRTDSNLQQRGSATRTLYNNLLGKYKNPARFGRTGAFDAPLIPSLMGPGENTLADSAKRDIIAYLIARPTTIAAGSAGRLQRVMQVTQIDDLLANIERMGLPGERVKNQVSGAIAAIKLSAYKANLGEDTQALLQAITADKTIVSEMAAKVKDWAKFGGKGWRSAPPGARNANVTLNKFAAEYVYMQKFRSAYSKNPVGAFTGLFGDGGEKTGLSMAALHITNRLRTALKLIGLDFTEGTYTNITDQLIGGFMFRRILPAMALVEMYRYVDWKINDWTGHGVTESVLNAGVVKPTIAGAELGEFFGVQKAAKWFGKVTGEEDRMNALKYLTMSGTEMEEFWQRGEVPIRRGRWWSLSPTAFEGQRTQFFVPNVYQRTKARGQYSVEGGKISEEFAFSHSWLPNPSYPLCLGKDTLIVTNNGLRSIDTIEVNDKVLTMNGAFNKVISTNKRLPYNNETIYSINTSQTVEPLIISQDHKVAVLKAGNVVWLPAKELEINDELITPFANGNENEWIDLSDYCRGFTTSKWFYPSIKPEVAELIEYFESKNTIYGHNKLLINHGYNQQDIEHAQLRIRNNGKIKRYRRFQKVDKDFSMFIGMFLSEGNIQGQSIKLTMNVKDSFEYNNVIEIICNRFNCSFSRIVDVNTVRYIISSFVLTDLIKSLCYKSTFNFKCKDKRIPSCIWKTTLQPKLAFVLAMLDFDGWVEDNRCRITSINYTLIHDIKALLSSISIPSTVHRKHLDGNAIILGKECNVSEAFTIGFNSATLYNTYGDIILLSYKIRNSKIKKTNTRSLKTVEYNEIIYTVDYIKDISIIENCSGLWLFDLQVENQENFCTIYGIVHNSPLNRILDPYAFEKATYSSRPYPLTGDFFTGPYGPITPLLNATIGEVIKPTKKMHPEYWDAISNGGSFSAGGGMVQAQITSANDRVVNMAISGGSTINAPYAIGVQATNMLMGSVGVPAGVVAAATPSGVWTQPSEIGRMSDTAYRLQEMSGIYGFGVQAIRTRLGLQPEYHAASYVPKASEAYSFGSRYWGAQLGGMGDLVLPGQSELSNITFSEMFRRFVPRQPGGEKMNPIPNTVYNNYPWMPGPMSGYFEDYSKGDIYSNSFAAYRFPGEPFAKAYGLHPDETGPYGKIDQLRSLSKIAPWSREYKTLNKSLARSIMSPEEREIYQTVRSQVSEVNEKYQFAPYRFKDLQLEQKEYTYMGVTDNGYLNFKGLSTPIKVAGLQEGGLSTALQGILEPGQRVKMKIDVNRPKFSWEQGQKVLEAYIPDISDKLLDQGYEQDIGGSPLSYFARTGPVERMIGSVWESMTHTWNPITTKFIQRRTALEEYERTNVYGLSFAPWTHPYSSFVRPQLESVGGKSLYASILTGVTTGMLAGRGPGKALLGGLGGATLGLNKLRTMAQEAITGKAWVPGHVQERWEQEEYADVLQYVGAARQYSLLRRRALAAGEDDPETLWQKDKALQNWMSESKSNIRASLLERTAFGGVSKKDFMARNPIAAQAFSWREKMGQTLYGADLGGNLLDIQQAIPKERRMYFEEFLNAPVKDRKKIIERLPLLERRVYEAAWGAPVEDKPTLTDYFKNNFLPSPDAAIWSSGVDWEKVRVRMIERAGENPSQYGYYPQEVSAAEQYAIPVPTPDMNTMGNVKDMLYQILGQTPVNGLGITVTPTSEPGFSVDLNVVRDYRPIYNSMIEESMNNF